MNVTGCLRVVQVRAVGVSIRTSQQGGYFIKIVRREAHAEEITNYRCAQLALRTRGRAKCNGGSNGLSKAVKSWQ